jgi:hypothetical protein
MIIDQFQSWDDQAPKKQLETAGICWQRTKICSKKLAWLGSSFLEKQVPPISTGRCGKIDAQ